MELLLHYLSILLGVEYRYPDMTNKAYIHMIKPVAVAAAFLLNQGVAAATVYQWTDAEGVVHFSDVAPDADTPVKIEEIEFAEYADPGTDPDKYSITSQLERMSEWRRQLTEERLAKKQLQLEALRLAQEKEASRFVNNYDPQPYYMPTYYLPTPGYFNGYQPWYGHYYSGHNIHKFNTAPKRQSQASGIAFRAIFD